MRRLVKASSVGQPVRFSIAALPVVGVLAAISFLFLTVGAGSALALPDNYVEVGHFGDPIPGTGDGAFDEPGRAAVYDATGEVFVIDRGNNRVNVFTPSGDSGTFETQFGSGTLNQPFGIAIDQSTGSVYVSSAGSNQIVKFKRTAGIPPTFAPDGTFTSPPQGSGSGQIGSFASALAVDPTDDTLWVADSGNSLVEHFSADGKALLGSFDGATSPNQPPSGPTFAKLSDLAIDSAGNVIVAHGQTVERFGAGGGYQLTVGTQFEPVEEVGALETVVAIEPGTDRVFVGYGNRRVALFDGSTGLVDFLFAGESFGPLGLAVDGSAPNHLYVVGHVVFLGGEGYGENGAWAFRPTVRPTVTINPASDVQQTSAHFSGTVNPQGEETSWYFEYGYEGGGSKTVPATAASAGSGTSSVSVEADAHDLIPNRKYSLRLFASSPGGQNSVEAPEFTTEPVGATIETMGAAPVTATAARLNGRINPYGLPTSYYFEYGPDASYGQSAPVGKDGDTGGGFGFDMFSQELTGLAPETAVHYRIVAENAMGKVVGEDQTLRTRAAGSGPPKRGIELVNFPNKGNQPARSPIFGGKLVNSADSSAILWGVDGTTPSSSTGAFGVFVATRDSDGWHSRNPTPPNAELIGDGELSYKAAGASSDFGQFLFEATSGVLSPNERTLVRVDANLHQEVLYALPPGGVANVSDDLMHVYSNSNLPLDPSAQPGTQNIYDFGSGTPVLVSRMPSGDAPACGITGFGGIAKNEPISTKTGAPPRAFFETPGDDCGLPSQLYMYDQEASESTLISGPALPGGEEGPAEFVRASEDGSRVIFATPRRLKADDLNQVRDIYLYTVGKGPECLTCLVADPEFLSNQILASGDLSHVFFVSGKELISGRSGPGLYVLHDGEIEYIGPNSSFAAHEERAAAAPDGKILYYATGAGGTADNTSGFTQIYRWAEEDHSLECISCPHGHAATTYEEHLSSGQLTNDGNAFVFSTKAVLDRKRDVNNGLDIYEWRDGQTSLVTDGVTEYPGDSLKLSGVSGNGVNVVFESGVNLTGYERDNAGQVYVARIGGGFPPPPTPPAPCAEDACQGPLAPTPALPGVGSADFNGPGTPASHRQRSKKKHKKKKRNAHQKSNAQKTRKGAHR